MTTSMPVKGKRILIISTVILILILSGVIILFFKINPLLESIINRELKALIRIDPNRLYDFTYDSLDIDIYKGNVFAKNLKVIPRKEVIDSLLKIGQVKKFIVTANLEKFEMVNFDWIEFIRTGAIDVDVISLAEVDISYYLNQNAIVKKEASLGNDILDQDFISAKTNLFELINANYRLYKIKEDTTLALSFDSLQIRFTNFYSDSALIHQPIGYELEEVDLAIFNIENNLIKDYRVSSEKLAFNSTDNLFSINGIQMIPSPQKVDSKNWLQLNVSSLKAHGLDYDSLLYYGHIILKEIELEKPQFTYVRPVERLQIDTIRILPATTFKRIPIPVAIDTIDLLQGRFDYLKHGYNEPMISISATDINVKGLFFSTDPVLLNKNKTFYISGSTKFLEEAELILHITFPLTDPVNTFIIKGKMDTLNARSLNPIIKNSKQLAVADGVINSLQFEITGNDTLSTGALDIDYRNLKLVALKVNENDFTDIRQKGFLTGLLNTVTKTKNDPNKSSFTEGIIYLERDPYFTFLDYSLESLMTGILTSMVPESKLFMKPKKSNKKQPINP